MGVHVFRQAADTTSVEINTMVSPFRIFFLAAFTRPILSKKWKSGRTPGTGVTLRLPLAATLRLPQPTPRCPSLLPKLPTTIWRNLKIGLQGEFQLRFTSRQAHAQTHHCV